MADLSRGGCYAPIVESMEAGGVTVRYEAEEIDDARLVAHACRRTVDLLERLWGIRPPRQCQVYVMTEWRRMALSSAPLPWRAALILTLPLWGPGVAKTWRSAGGWAQRYGDSYVIGIKPARMLRLTQAGFLQRLFVEETLEGKVERLTCHELTHAATAGLRLPEWLQEGLAMVTEDAYACHSIVRAESVGWLTPSGRARQQPTDALLEEYARAYWLTRFVEEERPGLLRTLLPAAAPPGGPARLTGALAGALGLDPAAPERDLQRRAARRFSYTDG